MTCMGPFGAMFVAASTGVIIISVGVALGLIDVLDARGGR